MFILRGYCEPPSAHYQLSPLCGLTMRRRCITKFAIYEIPFPDGSHAMARVDEGKITVVVDQSLPFLLQVIAIRLAVGEKFSPAA